MAKNNRVNKKKTCEKNGKILFSRNKSQIFIVSLVFIFLFGIISAFFLLGYLYEDKTAEEHLGTYQASIVDSFIDSDKTMIYLDSVAKSSVDDALMEFMANGAVKTTAATGEDSDGPRCGSYVYNLWNSHSDDCFYDYTESFKEYMDTSINKKLSLSSDINLAKPASGTYSFYDTGKGTEIKAKLDAEYEFFLFKTGEQKKSLDLKNYLSIKQQYSGSLIWPIDTNVYPSASYISSCFGYRGPESGGTVNHGGIDIPAKQGTPVIAAANGKVIELPNKENKGTVIIEHGNNFRTAYTHLSKHIVTLGQEVTQGEKIGEVGMTGTTNYHLHFEVIDNNLDPDLKFEGIPAYIRTATRIKINPVCFINQDYLKDNNIVLTFNEKSIACNNICSADKSTCSLNSCDKDNLCMYKYCDLYNIEKKCQTAENDEWKILSVISESQIDGDEQKILIKGAIENNADDCVTITPEISIVRVNDEKGTSRIGREYVVRGEWSDVYKKTKNSQFTEAIVECKFTEDTAVSESMLKDKKCVLIASSNEEYYYMITEFLAIDKYDRTLTNNDGLIIKVDKLAAKQTTNTQTGTQTTNTQTGTQTTLKEVSLSKNEIIKLESTKKTLSQNTLPDGTTWLEYIKKVAGENQIPPEIILAMITQESGGENYEKTSKNNAVGITQVEPHQHIDSIRAECGKEYIAECNNNYASCKFNMFHDDIKCQIDTAVVILKKNFDAYSKDTTYQNTVKKICQISDRQQKYLSYTGWARALRAYNGFGCAIGVGHYEYVEEVMKWANTWGYDYSQQYYSMSKDEISKGIIGKYTIQPSFSAYTNFDFSILRKLSDSMKSTIQDCMITTKTREECVEEHMKIFNDDMIKNPPRIKAELSRDCDTLGDEKTLNLFVEQLEECRDSTADKCQCVISNSNNDFIIKVVSDDETSTLTAGKYSAKMYTQLKDSDSKALNREINLKNITMIKESLGKLKVDTANTACNPIKSMFRFCLKTDYEVSFNAGGKQLKKNLVLKYAITIRDNIPPEAVKDLTIINMHNTVGNIMLSWPKNPETDIAGYNLYVGDSVNDFATGKAIKISVDVSQRNFDTYKSIDFGKEPECNVINNLYCEFLYKTVKTENNADKKTLVALQGGRLYNLDSSSNFLYIISGSDNRLKLTPGKQKHIAITAYDLDGNEIPLITNGKITKNIPIKQITPKDFLAPGFAYFATQEYDPQNIANMYFKWNSVEFNIDGSMIDVLGNYGLIYNIYTSKVPCDQDYMSGASLVSTTTNTEYSMQNIASDVNCIFVIAAKQSIQYPKACCMIRYDNILSQPDNMLSHTETCVVTNP